MSFKALGHYRLASAKLGDDATLTRYVRIDGVKRTKQHQPRIPGLAADFIEQARTKFRSRVLRVADMTNLLVSGHSNVKIGRDVRKGKLRGYWIYTLSLEERKTCPRSCDHWQTCYGNNMPFAKRVDHTDPAFLPALAAEIEMLLKRHKTGVLIRLHALGDFYSPEYVGFWRDMLERHPRLAIYGYTARQPLEDEIGAHVYQMGVRFGRRAMVRFSNGFLREMSTVSIKTEADCPANAFVCPEQTGKTRCCATCAACWSTTKTVAFLEH